MGSPVEPTPLDHFLTARWGLFLPDRAGRTRYWPNEHPSWPLRSASLDHLDDGLLAAGGFPGIATRPPDHVRFSEGVRTRFGPRSGPHGVHTPVTKP